MYLVSLSYESVQSAVHVTVNVLVYQPEGSAWGLSLQMWKLVASSSVGTSLQCVYNNCNSIIRVVLGLSIVFMSAPPY